MHNLLIKVISQVTKLIRFFLVRAEPLNHLEAEKGFLIRGCDIRKGILDPGGMLLCFSSKESDEADDNRPDKKSKQITKYEKFVDNLQEKNYLRRIKIEEIFDEINHVLPPWRRFG